MSHWTVFDFRLGLKIVTKIFNRAVVAPSILQSIRKIAVFPNKLTGKQDTFRCTQLSLIFKYNMIWNGGYTRSNFQSIQKRQWKFL